MDFYLMQNGERRGPFRIFQVKEMLDRGEAALTDLGWHQGMEEWLPLPKIEALGAFLPRTTPPPLPEEPEEDAPAPEPTDAYRRFLEAQSGPKLEPGLSRWELFGLRAVPRFLARLLDDVLFFTLIWGVGVAVRWLDPFALLVTNVWLGIAQALAWIFLEALLLHLFGATPGKWLLNLRVTDRTGAKPSYRRALKRSFFICACAWGFGIPSVWLFGSLVSLMLFLNNGYMVWDYLASTQVRFAGPAPFRWMAVVAIFVAYFSVKAVILFTQPIPANLPPDLRQRIEESRRQLEEALHPAAPTPNSPATPPVPTA